jgi:3-phenylpropionate/trans-cinnamate dioxygenase ferredoxin subunit
VFNYAHLSQEECDYVDIASIDDLPENERLFLEIDDLQIVLFNLAGQIFAIGDVCTHDNGPLGDGELDGFEIICPRHGARFDIRSGQVKALPAIVDIPAYPVRIVDHRIQVGLPKTGTDGSF